MPTEDKPTASQQKASDYREISAYTFEGIALKISDLSVVIGLTSLAITAVQVPVTGLILNRMKSNVFLPGGIGIASMKALYDGWTKHWAASSTRSTYVLGTKNVSTQEVIHDIKVAKGQLFEREISEVEATVKMKKHTIEATETAIGQAEQQELMTKECEIMNKSKNQSTPSTSVVAAIAAGETALTQVTGSITTLNKLGLQFDWRTRPNLYVLTKTGLVSRYSGSMIGSMGLCVGSKAIAETLPFSNQKIKDTLGGFTSGALSALVSAPFSVYGDYLLTKVTLVDQELHAPKAKTVIYDAWTVFKNMADSERLSFARTFSEQAGLRMIRGGLTVGIIGLVGSVLGSDPASQAYNQAKEIGFFDAEKTKFSAIKEKFRELTTAKPNIEKTDNIKKPDDYSVSNKLK